MENALKEKTLLKKFVDVYLEMSHLQKSFPSASVHFPFVRKQLHTRVIYDRVQKKKIEF